MSDIAGISLANYIFGYVEESIEVVLLDAVQVVETIVGVIVHVDVMCCFVGLAAEYAFYLYRKSHKKQHGTIRNTVNASKNYLHIIVICNSLVIRVDQRCRSWYKCSKVYHYGTFIT